MQLMAEELSVILLQDAAWRRLVGENLAILWKDWPKNMLVTVFDSVDVRFSLTGECPHCKNKAVFAMVGQPDFAPAPYGNNYVASIMRCPGCREWILAIVHYYKGAPDSFRYETHYPLGTPNEILDPSIPKEVADNFKEAIRCQWVKAYRACVVMCGRAIESSVIALGAHGGKLIDKIDDLATKVRLHSPLENLPMKSG